MSETVVHEFEAVFREQFPKMVAYGLAMTGRIDVASELAQESLARAHARWNEVGTMSSPLAWVRRVMTNLLIDHHRRTHVEARALERVAAQPPLGAIGSDDTAFHELIGDLPPRQRAVVALHYLDDVAIAEIADSLGIANGTVKALLWKARQNLARKLRSEQTDANHAR